MKKESQINFIKKILKKIDKIDSQELKQYFEILTIENDLFKQILKGINEGVVLLDKKSEIIFINPAAENLLSEKSDNWLGKNGNDLFKSIGIDNPTQEFYENSNLSVTYQLEGLSSVASTVNVRIFPVINKMMHSIVIIFSDMSVYQQEKNTHFEDSKLDSIRLLSSSIAHEIGNPLNSIMIHLQLAEKEINRHSSQSDASLAESINVAHSEVKRIHQIIQDFLLAVRPLKVNYKGIDINELIKDVIQPYKESFNLKKIHLKLVLQSNLQKIQIDKKQISQALGNLIKNAVEAMAEGGNLNVKTEQKNNWLEISVEDTGVGISKEFMRKMFEPYITTKKHGSGLGLMIVHRIIKDHFGHIAVKSKESQGSKFTIKLPFKHNKPVKLISAKKE